MPKSSVARAFAHLRPSILEEHVAEWFELDEPVPFMEKVFPILETKQADIPAVTHVDGSGRLQSVMKSVAPRYHGLISRFCEKTGVPILLNTSFNENEPIVNAPVHAGMLPPYEHGHVGLGQHHRQAGLNQP